MDVCNVFLNTPLPDDTPVFMYAPNGYECSGQVIHLHKALYGLKQSPCQWVDTLKSFLCSALLSLSQCPVDACLFLLVVDDIIVLLVGIHVDDLVLMGVDSYLQWLRSALLCEFKMEDIGRPSCVLGMDIDLCSDGSIHLFQSSYITKLQHWFNFEDCKSKDTPMSSTVHFTKDDCTKPGNTPPLFPYHELVACLLFVSISTCPGIAFMVKELSHWLNCFGAKHVAVAKQCICYLAGTKQLGLLYHHQFTSVLGGVFYSHICLPSEFPDVVCAFSDADWAGQLDDHKSTSGMVLMFNGAAITWWSQVIHLVACSSQDAEFMSLSDACCEVVFIQSLLNSISFHVDKMTLFSDNKGSLCLAKDPADHQKSKHIAVRYFFICQCVEMQQVQVCYVKTTEQLADLLTKALTTAQHTILTLAVLGHSASAALLECVCVGSQPCISQFPCLTTRGH